VPTLLETARQAIAHLSELTALVQLADTPEALRALRGEVAAATGGQGPGAKLKGGRRGPARPTGSVRAPYRRVPLGDGWEALVGASAAGNVAVTFELGQPDDVWLHARGVPGAHVILRGPGRGEPPGQALRQAAGLAAWHSAARAGGQVEVDYTRRRHVRKIPNGPPGLVRYSHEQTVRVESWCPA
jgi:predicted ribosome quality control (RQC) complex YloA/Tae2 family protein